MMLSATWRSLRRATVLGCIPSGALLLAASCAPEDVVVASYHSDGGGDAKPSGKACTRNDECGVSSFCEKQTCGEASGVCQVRPTFCDSTRAPVCGCDGVTFWNDCIRRARGEHAAAQGECTTAPADCAGPTKKTCALPGASCAILVPLDVKCDGPMHDQATGVCWVLPLTCPPASDPTPDPKWGSCMPGPPGPKPECLSTCDAIRTNEPHRALGLATCPM